MVEGSMPLILDGARTMTRLPEGTPALAEVIYHQPQHFKSDRASKMRYMLSTSMQEPVWKFETWLACFDALQLQPLGAGQEVMRYELDPALADEQVRRVSPTHIQVSRRLMSLVRVSRGRLAMALPVGNNARAHVERELPGQGGLGEPEQWGWDTPGSPDWTRIFLRYPYDLREHKVPQADDYLDAKESQRLWKVILENAGARGSGLDPNYRTTTSIAIIHAYTLEVSEFLRRTERSLADAQMGELRFGPPKPKTTPPSATATPAPPTSGLSEGLKSW
jgi:hypothetical protein